MRAKPEAFLAGVLGWASLIGHLASLRGGFAAERSRFAGPPVALGR